MLCNRCDQKIHSGKIETLKWTLADFDLKEHYCRHCFNSEVIIERREIVARGKHL